MPEAKYEFTIATATATGLLSPSLLVREIRSSSIVTALDRVDVGIDSGGDPDVTKFLVVMKDTLSGGDETTLNAIVAAHTGAEEDEVQEFGLQDYGKLDKENSRLRFEGFEIDCEALANPSDLVYVSFPFNVSMLYGSIPGHNVNNGDFANCWIQTKQTGGPETRGQIGVLTADKTTSDDTLEVSPLPFKLVPGDVIRIQGESVDYIVLNHNVGAGTIKLSQTLNSGKSTNDILYWRGLNCSKIPLVADREMEFGKESFGSQLLPVNMELVIEYHHKTAPLTPKTIPFMMAYYHGELAA